MTDYTDTYVQYTVALYSTYMGYNATVHITPVC